MPLELTDQHRQAVNTYMDERSLRPTDVARNMDWLYAYVANMLNGNARLSKGFLFDFVVTYPDALPLIRQAGHENANALAVI